MSDRQSCQCFSCRNRSLHISLMAKATQEEAAYLKELFDRWEHEEMEAAYWKSKATGDN